MDMSETYKYTHNMYKTNKDTYFSYPKRILRGHEYKLSKQYSRTDIRKNFFSYRVVTGVDWNQLPSTIAEARRGPTSLQTFKRQMRSLPVKRDNRPSRAYPSK